MSMLYRVEMDDGKVFKVNDPWPETENGADFTIGAMFQVAETPEDDETLPESAHLELWAAPVRAPGQAPPADDSDTYCMRVWYDGPVKYSYEHWKWGHAMQAIALRLNLLSDEDDEPAPHQSTPGNTTQPVAPAAAPPG